MYNFDEIVDRYSTSSMKWDQITEKDLPKDTIPMWVADMDFKVLPEISEEMKKRIDHGVFGYSSVSNDYYASIINWMKRRHNWDIDKESIVLTPGIVTALKICVNAFTNEGDAILVQKPVYHPFDSSIENNKRIKVTNPLIYKDNEYKIDFEDFENKIKDNNVKMFVLCNPHNPIGRVYTKEELNKMGTICKKYNVLVVSDEIHSDFIFEGVHIPFSEAGEDFKNFSVICTAPSKTFNLAGLDTSNIIITNEELREKFNTQISTTGVNKPVQLGQLACQIAYDKGEKWCDEMLEYIKGNYDYLDNFLKENMPEIKLIKPEGTYLAWVDFNALNLSNEDLHDLLLNKAHVWFNDGYIFGKEGSGFQRVNLATPRSYVEEALNRIKEVLKKEGLIK